MRINYILPFKYFTGGVKIIFENANRLSNRGHDVKIYHPLIPFRFGESFFNVKGNYLQARSFLANIKQGKTVNWFQLKVPLIRVPWITNRFIDDADICFASAWPTAYAVNRLSQSKGKKLYYIQGYEIWRGPLEKVHNSYRLPLTQIAVSAVLKNVMVEKFNRTDCILLPHGIDFTRFYNDKKVLNTTPKVLMQYNPMKEKGFFDGIKAFEIVKEKLKDVELVLFGFRVGPGIPSYSTFHENPSATTLRELYSTADIFLWPSWNEGFGIPPMEAMACKCAVVSTKTGTIWNLPDDGKTALTCEPKDVQTMATHMITLLTNPSKLEQLSYAGYNYIRNFSWDDSICKMEAIFNSV
jgi:glycosyltransferase involved in cell wall biosynthesis